ncbi:sigma-54 interaction domain-containing protein [Pseudomonas duriflava]|nr:sigma 54-interacting transcriptional regulator [Pseudomonas duriflava]
MTMANDLSDYRQISLRAIRSLFESIEQSSEGTVIVDRDLRIVWMNERYARRLGLPDAQSAIGRICEEVIPASLLREVVTTGQPILLDLLDTPKGPLVVMRLPIHDDSGTVIGAIGFALFDELRTLAPVVTRFLRMQEELASTRRSLQNARQAKYSFAHFVGSGPACQEVKRRARRAATVDSSVLLLGETGTGKELLAHAIHAASPRANKPFVSINAAAIPEPLLEAEFFGTAPGAFTGADRKARPGKLQIAQGGTLFLDEVGDMPLSLQAKLLRVLQEKEFEPLGSNQVLRCDVRLIAATSRNLEAMISDGTFRADLYYRLNVLPLHVPPLRERSEDMSSLCEAILDSLLTEGHAPRELDDQALALLACYDWPGNVRELRNVLERAALLSDETVIGAATIASALGRSVPLPKPEPQPVREATVTRTTTFMAARQEFERSFIMETLAACSGEVDEAARRLGLGRSTFYKKMAALNVLS